MQRFFKTLALLLALCCTSLAHAELKIDRSIKQKEVKRIVDDFETRITIPYAREQTYSFRDYKPEKPEISGTGNASYLWLLNGERYYSNLLSFVVDYELTGDCAGYPAPRHEYGEWEGPDCDGRNYRHSKCHLFMLKENGQIAGVGRIDIARDKSLITGQPFCYEIRAMTATPEVPDSFLIALNYIDGNWSCGPCAGIEPDKFQTTVLLRVKKEPDGSLNLTQDNSCLSSSNRIGNLAVARKKLRECAAVQR